MKILNVLAVSLLVVCSSMTAAAQSARQNSKLAIAEKEVRQFYETYADDLRERRRESIVERYDRRGAYFMGNGRKSLDSFESIKDRYMNKWKGPKGFQWTDLSFEILSPTHAVVVGK